MIYCPGTTTRSWCVLGGGVIAVLAVAVGLHCISNGFIRVFGRWDVIVCSFLSATPLAAVLATRVQRWHRVGKLSVVLACFLMAIGTLVIAANLITLPYSSCFAITLFRGTISLTAMLGLFTGFGLSLDAMTTHSWGHRMILLTMMLLFALLIPAAYADTVAESLGNDLQQSLDSRRFATAHRLAFQLWQLNPSGRVDDRPVRSVVQELAEIIAKLNASIDRSIRPEASSSEVGNRVTSLMVLDRNEEALSLLEPMTRGSQFQPIALDYVGLCYQRLGRFGKSESAYRKAVAFWKNQPPSETRRNSLASAWKGIGYATRRLNRRTDEEQAYQRLVNTMPTAENHLLLAQCYLEHQKTKLAATHAAIAMDLDSNLRTRSESIMSSMTMEHFGCLQVPRR